MATDALTTPISQTATQFRLDSINLDVQGQMVTMQVSLVDGAGAVLKTVALTDTWAAVAIPASAATTLRNLVVTYLKGKGTIN